jgi:hypothetical protein
MGDGDAMPAVEVVACDVSGLPADFSTVDSLARLQLATLRQGRRLVVRGADRDLMDLLDWVGLGDLL